MFRSTRFRLDIRRRYWFFFCTHDFFLSACATFIPVLDLHGVGDISCQGTMHTALLHWFYLFYFVFTSISKSTPEPRPNERLGTRALLACIVNDMLCTPRSHFRCSGLTRNHPTQNNIRRVGPQLRSISTAVYPSYRLDADFRPAPVRRCTPSHCDSSVQ